MGTEVQAYANLVKTTMGTVNPVPAVVPVQLTLRYAALRLKYKSQ